MSKKINDGMNSKQRYLEKMERISMAIPPEKARDIKDCAALAGLSVTKYLLMCHETFQQCKMNKD